MRPVQGVYRHIIHEHIQPIVEVKKVTTIPAETEAAISMEPPWRRDNEVEDDFDVWFRASSSVASKNALFAVIITIVAVIMMTPPLVI